MFVPIIGLVYLIDSKLFWSEEKTDDNGQEYLVPREGIPSWWAAFYAVSSVCWGDYRYLDLEKPLEVNFGQFIQIWFFSAWQIAVAAITLLPYMTWSVLGSFSLFTIFWYEVAFLSFSENRELAEQEGAPVLPEDEWL